MKIDIRLRPKKSRFSIAALIKLIIAIKIYKSGYRKA